MESPDGPNLDEEGNGFFSANAIQRKTSAASLILEDSGERIEAALSGDRITKIPQAIFRVPAASEGSEGKIVSQGDGYVYIHDEDHFVARGFFTGKAHLDITERSWFSEVKLAVLKDFQINEIFCDELGNRKEEKFRVWVEINKNLAADVKSVIEFFKICKKFPDVSDRSVDILKWIANDSSLPEKLKNASKDEGSFG